VVAIFSGAMARLMIHQARFFDDQSMSREARTVARGGLNLLISDLRMIERPRGIVSASATALTARVPYAFGLFCGNAGAVSIVSLAPVDSLMFADAGFSGFAWRDTLGTYTYIETGTSVASTPATTCGTAGITTLSGGKRVALSPALPAAAKVGTLVLLHRRMTYEFRESDVLPGRRALWRTPEATGDSEELIAPFDSTAGFRYFASSDTLADATPPALPSTITGVELVLDAESHRASRTRTDPRRAHRTTAVFFMNRPQ